jgi:hypothetical protein
MPFDQLFTGKVDTSGGGTTTSPTTTTSVPSTPSPPSTGQDQGGGVGSYVPPLVQNIAAGAYQGAIRDPAQTIVGNSVVAPIVDWVDRNVPILGRLDQWAGTSPRDIAAATQAYEKQYGSSDAAAIGRLGGNVLAGAAIPGGEAVGGLVGAGRLGTFLAPALRGAYAGGTGSALTAGGYGENPLVAGAEGALGGAVVGRVLPSLGAAANKDLQGLADRLGIKLTGGQSQGGILQSVEDLSKRLPLSGAASTEAAQNAQMVSVLERNMGVAKPTGHLDLPEVGAAKNAAGNDMSRIANGITIDGGAMAGPATVPGAAAPNLVTRLNQIVADHSSLGTDQLDYKAAVNLRNAVYASITNGNGTMSGTDFARLIANGGTLDRFASHSDSQVKNVAAEVRSALFDAADNSSNPAGIMKDFRDAQLRYKASATAADAIGPTGSTEAMTPAGLKQAINRHYADQLVNPRATGPGYDMPDLSRLIRGIPKLASSGTAERLSLMNMLGIGGAGSGVLGALSGPIALSTAAHAALPYAAIAGAGAASRKLPWSQIAGAMPNQLLPRIAGQGVGRVLSGNALSPSP